MGTTEKKYNVGTRAQLIDLNGDQVNFEVVFDVVSENRAPFEAVIVDQNTLDTKAVIDYKPVKDGRINGTILADKNVYQNYFLLLKADQDCVCNVTVTMKPVDMTTTTSATSRVPPRSGIPEGRTAIEDVVGGGRSHMPMSAPTPITVPNHLQPRMPQNQIVPQMPPMPPAAKKIEAAFDTSAEIEDDEEDGRKSKYNWAVILLIVVLVLAVIGLIGFYAYKYFKARGEKKTSLEFGDDDLGLPKGKKTASFQSFSNLMDKLKIGTEGSVGGSDASSVVSSVSGVSSVSTSIESKAGSKSFTTLEPMSAPESMKM
jgi:hypothetical protein